MARRPSSRRGERPQQTAEEAELRDKLVAINRVRRWSRAVAGSPSPRWSSSATVAAGSASAPARRARCRRRSARRPITPSTA